MHTVLRQVEFRLIAELLLAILIPIAGFLWWRLGLDMKALAFRGWWQRTRRKLFGAPKPEMFYTDGHGRLRRIEPPYQRIAVKALVWVLNAIAICGIIGFVGANIQLHTPALTIMVGALVLGFGYLVIWASWTTWANR
jgi:hypothetical protein